MVVAAVAAVGAEGESDDEVNFGLAVQDDNGLIYLICLCC